MKPFLNYLSMPSRVSLRFWHAARFVSIAGFLAIVMAALAWPDDTLVLFWGLIVPVLPLVFLIAPGSWRNVCPLAGANQASRYLGVTKQIEAPAWLRKHGFSIAATFFVALVIARKVLFNRNATALAILMLALLLGAALGGWFFKGKSGWCSSICPLLPVQRVYGQTPFVGVPNSHCRPCLGCTKNCYDFNPRVAYVADMHEHDPQFRGPRRFFVGSFPGLVLAFFRVPDSGALSVLEVLGGCSLWIAGSAAVFALLDSSGVFAPNTLPPLFGAAAFGLFYWYAVPRAAAALHTLVGWDWGAIVGPGRIAVVALATAWLVRSWRVQRQYAEDAVVTTPVVVDLTRARSALGVLGGGDADGTVEIEFEGRTIAVPVGTSILDAAESAELPIDAGCRMGVCGADPVAVVVGYDSLSPIRRDEADTLERLGLGAPNRMACVARAEGRCAVSLAPDRTSVARPSAPTFTPDPTLERVVIVGNGIAGVTAADFLRRSHPTCEIALVGREPHQLYNRMGIARLIHGRSAMQGLYLLPIDWYDRNRVAVWLNTKAVAVDREARRVRLGTGEELEYDRLVLAMGGRSQVPAIEGFGLPGCFVLREAEDAMRIRAYSQDQPQHRAVVAGGGLLGLEAAHALHELRMEVTVFERSSRLLRSALDPVASELLRSYFEALGILIISDTEAARVEGDGRLEAVVTVTGHTVESEVLLVATGVAPNTDLAEAAGLRVNRGVVVDERLRTTDPAISAIGDVAEFEGRVWGLWPVAVQQAQIAATNIAGGDRSYANEIPTVILKGVGLDVVSFGRIEVDAGSGDHEVAERGEGGHTYRKVVFSDGRVVGGVFLGFAADAQAAQDARADGRVFAEQEIGVITAGDWSALACRAPARASR